MNNFTINNQWVQNIKKAILYFDVEQWIFCVTCILAVTVTAYSYIHGYIIAYGDAESHLNIAKRVVDSLTPGFAQLGGIWLPLPHLLLVPFVYFNLFWKTGLAGSIVSGVAYMISAQYMYRLGLLITKHRGAAFIAAMIFAINPNILYMQSTPMTELSLIVFFILSSFYFISFLYDDAKVINLLFAALFGFCASLSRYDGWSLVLMEAGVLVLFYLPYKLLLKEGVRALFSKKAGVLWSKLEGRFVIFATLAFFGVLLWLFWGFLILGDPLYFTHSEFSAKSQQNSWFMRGELPAYHDLWTSFLYYFVTTLSNVGIIIFVLALLGSAYFFFDKTKKHRWFIMLILAVPFIFNVATLFLGQSVIFIPSITPVTFEWKLFNVRYGVMMVPVIAIAIAYLWTRVRPGLKMTIIGLIVFQSMLYGIGYARVITLDDGVVGLSSAIAKIPDAQGWLEKNYDHGMLLTDDFARTISIVRLPIAMKDVIYIGNKPYWEESLIEPEKYARWIVMQKNDTLWTHILDGGVVEGRLYAHFNKVYTSGDILIFRRIGDN